LKLFYLSASEVPSRAANSVNVMKMSHAFARMGHQVTLFARPGGASTNQTPFDFYGVDPTFEIATQGWPRIPALGGQWYALRTWRRARKLGAPDLCYGRHVPSLLRAAQRGCAARLEVHAPPDSPLQSFQLSQLIAQRAFEALVCISDALRAEYLRLFPSLRSRRIIVAHDGADAQPRRPLPASASPLRGRPDAPRIGYIGHLYAGKGMEIIVELARSLPEMDFHVVGGTEADLQKWRAAYSFSNLIMYGYVPHGQLPRFMDEFDVVLAPYQRSVSTMGGGGDVSKWMSPLKLFEYMAAGKAILVSDLPVLREVIDDGVAGLLCEPADPSSWAGALRRLVGSPQLRRTMGENARELLTRKYTWSRRAAEVLN
jgi:glycosyltransferase involved in cell wall biosynthesis